MYNFLDPKLLPKVTPVQGSLEGYEASNLISENPIIKSRGFLTYSCIKPPVDIDFELICPVSLHYISVTCTIGTQRVTGIELQAKTDTKNSDFTTIGKAFLQEDKVLFCNSRYYTRENAPGIRDNDHVGFFKANLFRIFINAKFVRVRILRTERSTPGLGPVEIWGRVSKLCPRMTVQTITKLMSKKGADNRKNGDLNCFSLSGLNQEGCDGDFQINADFKDALTFEVMALPMTLPSGHTVDQSTLDKCGRNDAVYGRKCSDPFTGLPFTENRKPKLNAALKNRIDMFLLENADRKETYGIGRTVGSKIVGSLRNNSDQTVVDKKNVNSLLNNLGKKPGSVYMYHNLNSKRTRTSPEENLCKPSTSLSYQHFNDKPSTSLNYQHCNNNPSTSSNIQNCNIRYVKKVKINCDNINKMYLEPEENIAKEQKTFFNSNQAGDNLKNLDSTANNNNNNNLNNSISKVLNSAHFFSFTKEEIVEKNKQCENDVIAKGMNRANFISFTKEEEIVEENKKCVNNNDDNLDDAIARVLKSGNFISFTKDDESVIETKLNTKMCSCCSCDSILYSIPCGHVYCKRCLLAVYDKLICSTCGFNFCKNDVVRIHRL